MNAACQANGCELVGGEISVQPGVVADGTYILTASIAGIVEKNRIIDGTRMKPGDWVLAAVSNGLHTNGYSLVRMLMERNPELAGTQLGPATFLETIMQPHRSYYQEFMALQGLSRIHGLAHITGGGIPGNLKRILPEGCQALINLSEIKILPVFKWIRKQGNVSDPEMISTFNLGVGMVLVVAEESKTQVAEIFRRYQCDCYQIGEISAGHAEVKLRGSLHW
jgi:phosphoribosylformylglycinamidine cyclo-ligase